jgi:hypothetical protein
MFVKMNKGWLSKVLLPLYKILKNEKMFNQKGKLHSLPLPANPSIQIIRDPTQKATFAI